ncbi:MAG: DUF4382 domain-containing protein [Dehalococcoidales bacterium]|nr:DUF4382 domain-containing protein [Dehalococcoidales bacterium]
MKNKLVILTVIALVAIMALLAAACTPAAPTPTTTLPPATQTPSPTATTPPATTPPPTTPPTTTLPPPVPAAKGTLEVRVTDAPAADNVTSIMVTLKKVEVHRADAIPTPPTTPSDNTTTDNTTPPQNTDNGTEEGGQWVTVNLAAGMNVFDLLKIKGIEQTIGTNEMPIGKYTQVRLTVELIQVALNGGELKPATVASGILKLVHPFEIKAGQSTTLVIDFDADKSVNVAGNGEVKVSPVIKLIVK